MGDNVIEAAESLDSRIANIHRMQADISQAQLCRERLTRGDRSPSQVQTDKFTFGQMESHRGEIASYARNPTPAPGNVGLAPVALHGGRLPLLAGWDGSAEKLQLDTTLDRIH